MFSVKTLGLLGLVACAGLLLGGCQSSSTASSEPSHHMSAGAVACDKCQTTWVNEPTTAGGGKSNITGYSAKQVHECPDCKSAVQNFFATGELKHTCSACGGNMAPCEKH